MGERDVFRYVAGMLFYELCLEKGKNLARSCGDFFCVRVSYGG